MTIHLSIGQLAQAAAVNVETVRYYERRGLIAQPPKPAEGYRRYPPQTLARLRFIKRAQELGFTLEEVASLLALGEAHCQAVQSLAEDKLASVRAKLADLKRLERALAELVTQCRVNPDQSSCPIVETLLPTHADPQKNS